MTVRETPKTRRPLTRERIIQAAVALADERGLESLSMRKLGHELGVEAMSLYNHVDDKDAILDGMVDYLFHEIGELETSGDWKAAARSAASAARAVFAAHTWSVALLTARDSVSEGALSLMDSVIGLCLEAGFDAEEAHHAYHVIAGHVMGSVYQEINSFASSQDELDPQQRERLEQLVGTKFPNVAASAPYLMNCEPSVEFEYGLEIILSGIEARKSG